MRWFAFLAFATALRCGSTSPAPPAPVAPLPAAELARSYGLALEPAPADGVPIRVVDAASGKPVGDALVVAVDEGEFTFHENDEADVDGRGRGSASYWLRELGRAYATAADGRVVVPAPTAPCSLFVWSGANFGRTTLEVHDLVEHVVALAPRSLRVEVVDRDGQPQAGVPIQLAMSSLYPMSFGTTVGVTRADGRIDISAIELERGALRCSGRRDLVMLGTPISGGEMRAADAPVLEPVKFVLPECGSVELELQDAQRRPIRKDSEPAVALTLAVSSFGPARSVGYEPGARRLMRSLQVPIVDGRCRLESVELGAGFQFQLRVLRSDASCSVEDLHAVGESEPGTSYILGPVKAGEVTHVVLRANFFGAPVEYLVPDSKTGEPVEAPDDSSVATAHVRSGAPEPRSSVAISVQLDVPIEPCWLRVRLDGNRDPKESDSNPWIDVNGRATVRNVPAGTHSIEITRSSLSASYWEEEVVLHESAEFEVAPAQHLRDPRLADIDLRGRLRPRHFEIVDRDGSPLSGFVFQTRAEHPEFDAPMGFDGGRADFLAIVGDGLSTEIAASRFRPRVLAPDSTERRIVLERGIPIRLALAPGFELPSTADRHGKLYVGVSELPHLVDVRDELRVAELRPGADLRFEVAEPGAWPLVFRIGRIGDYGRENLESSYLLDTTIDVRDRADEQTFVITPDRDCWDRLVRKLRAPE